VSSPGAGSFRSDELKSVSCVSVSCGRGNSKSPHSLTHITHNTHSQHVTYISSK
jgi:hypothetical protein